MSQEQFYQTVQMQQEYEMKRWLEEYIDEEANVEYCPYCMNPRGGKRVCCGEVHFMPFKDFDLQEQMDIAHQEWEMAHPGKQ